MAKVSVGVAFSGALGWSMTIQIRFTSQASWFITIFNEVRTITCVAGSKFIGFCHSDLHECCECHGLNHDYAILL